jgi:signal transduction histidine kinase
MIDRHTILVVDDEADVVKSVQNLLRLDYKVLGATRAEDGFALMQQEEVHVVMTDQRMPETTGVEFLHKIRGAYPESIRLLFTGYADLRAVIDAINQGNVYRYITKPWDPDELSGVIREACERYDLMVERRVLLDTLLQKNTELETANTELRQASALKSAFINVASHELRTPLSILTGFTKLALRHTPRDSSTLEYLHRIERSGERLARLVEQLTTMLALGKFDHTLNLASTDLSALLQQAVDEVRPFAEIRRQTITTNVPDDLGDLSVDACKLRDSLSHLLLNAIKFTPDQGRINLSAGRSAQWVEISIKDTGIGILPADLPRIFQPFFTGFDVSTHSSGEYEFGRKGIGLGLTVVKAFIEMHGGTITAASQASLGATFTIRLLVPPAPQQPA